MLRNAVFQTRFRPPSFGGLHLVKGLCLLLCLGLARPVAAFEFKAAGMLGKVSYVRLEADASGRLISVAATPDASDPTAWTAPNYPSTNLCREVGAAVEREGCRSYAIYIPSAYTPGRPLPLHLSLHGNGGFAEAQIGDIPKNDGTGTTAADNSGLEGRYNQLAEQHYFAVVYPNGSINGQGTTVNGRDWNDCRVSEPNSTADDVAFIANVLDDIERTLQVDRNRIYVHGYSNGAMMTLRLYAELGERFTAFATTAGNQPRDDQTDCAEPVVRKPLYMVFGDLDTIVPYTGAGVRVSMRSADDTILYWTTLLGTEQPTTDDALWMQNWAAVPNRSSNDGAPDSRGYMRLYAGGGVGSQGLGPTQLLVKKIHQGGHSMSGLSQITSASNQATLGPKNLDIQLADELYAFFSPFAMNLPPASATGRFGGSMGLWLLPLLFVALRHRIRIRGVLCLALALLAAPAQAQAQAGELVLSQSLVAPDGLTRWYHYYKPSNLRPNAPVIILLHGGTLSYNKVIDQTRSSVQQQGFGKLDTTQWVDVADEAGALLIIPNGVSPTGDDHGSNDTAGDTQSWNDCRNADEASAIATGADDVGFINQLMSWAETRFDTNPDRIYVTGHSNGGTMSYRVAAELGHRVAGIAAFIANLPIDPASECARPAHPVSVFMLHGTADMTMRFEGGCDNSTGARGCTLSAAATRDFWVAHNKTMLQKPRIDYPNRDDRDGAKAGGSTVWSVLNAEGTDGTEVASFVVEGGGHTGPNTRYRLAPSSEATSGLQNHDIDAVWLAWEFLRNKTLHGSLPASEVSSRALACKGANASLGPVIDSTTTRPARFAWQGDYVQDDGICYLSRQSNAELRGYLLAPANWQQLPDRSLPVVVVGTGSGNAQAIYYLWAARELAGHGYIVLAEDPQGAGRSEVNGDPSRCTSTGCPGVPFQSAANFVDGFQSALDFVYARQHPWLAKADLSQVGLAGHSLSARAASFLGGADARVDAVVAWDNMSSTLEGDAGVSSGGGACGSVIGGDLPDTPPIQVNIRVPTMGQAADRQPTCDPTNLDPELKKAGYAQWRAAGVPAMLIDFRDAVHDNWAQSFQSVVQQLESFQYYTRGWFDLYLKGDESARTRLLSPEVKLSAATVQTADLYSTRYRSAAFMPEARIDCGDLRNVPCLPTPLQLLPPVISGLVDQLMDEDGRLEVVFTVSDPDSPGDRLTVMASAGDTALLPADGLVIEISGDSRKLILHPAPDANGSTTVTVTASDGMRSSSQSFRLRVVPVNDAPRVQAPSAQTIDEDSAGISLVFNISDPDNSAEELQMATGSSNPELTPAAGIALSGSGLSRSIRILPAADQSGNSTIALRVSDGVSSNTGTFRLQVNPVNDAPVLTGLADLSVEEDSEGSELPFQLRDVDSPGEQLTLVVESSDPELLPAERITLLGSGIERHLRLQAVANRHGSSLVRVSVSDGALTSSGQFLLQVSPVNDAPTLRLPADLTTVEGQLIESLEFEVGDIDSDALQVEADSNNPALLPKASIRLEGSGSRRQVSLRPVAGQSGTAVIRLTVSDGLSTSAGQFTLRVRPANVTPPPDPAATPSEPPASVARDRLGGSLSIWPLLTLLVACFWRRLGRGVLGLLPALLLCACGDSAAPTGTAMPSVPGGSELVCSPITLPAVHGAGSEIDGPPPAYDWQGEWQSCEVLFTSKMHGSQLYGVLFAPKNIDLARDRLPAVVVAPGSATGVQSQYQWSARDLAGHGYIALTVDPQGVGRSEAVSQPQTADNYIDAVVSALDYLLSPENPLQANVDALRLGAAGHSLSARVISYLQGEDPRLQAIVAWDNLSSTVEGDAGVSSGGGTCGSVIGGEVPLSSRPARQRVPSMGQASDAPPGCDQTNTDPEVKKTGYSTWRNAGVSSMEIVVLGKAHADWAQSPVADTASDSPKSKELQIFQHYTRAWFDLWLKQDNSAIKLLTAPQVVGMPREMIYSVDFRSALFLPQSGIDCADILTGNCPAFTP